MRTVVEASDLADILAPFGDDELSRYARLAGEHANSGHFNQALQNLRLITERLLFLLLDVLALAGNNVTDEVVALRERAQVVKVGRMLVDRRLLPDIVGRRTDTLAILGNYGSHANNPEADPSDVEDLVPFVLRLAGEVRKRQKEEPLRVSRERALREAKEIGAPGWLCDFVGWHRMRGVEAIPGGFDLRAVGATVLRSVPTANGPRDCGLAPYGFGDRATFLGRGVEVRELVGTIHRRDRVLLSGPSGSGKTSLLRAGVIPRLLEGGEQVVYVWDYGNGTHALVSAVRGAMVGVVVVLDQLERLLLPEMPVRDRNALLSLLLAPTPGSGKVVAAIREDHIGALLRVLKLDLPELIGAIAWPDDFVLVAELGKDEAAQALLGLLGTAARETDERFLRSRVLPELAGTTGSVSPAVIQLVAKRINEADATGERAWTEIGGVEGAVRAYADGEVRKLGTREPLAKVLLKAMTRAGERRWTDEAALWDAVRAYPEAMSGLPPDSIERTFTQTLDALRVARIVVTRAERNLAAGPECTLVHDRLVPAVEGWMSPAERERALAQSLLDRAVTTEAAGARETLSAKQSRLVERHWEQLQKSEPLRARAILARSRMARRLWTASVGAAVLAVVIFAVVAGVSAKRARASEREARARAAEARQRTAEANHERDTGRYQALMARARELDAEQFTAEAVVMLTAALDHETALGILDGEARDALLERTNRHFARDLVFRNCDVAGLSISPDGARTAVACVDGRVRLWNSQTGGVLGTIDRAGDLMDAVLASDGSRAFVYSVRDGTVSVWDLNPLRPAFVVNAPAYSHLRVSANGACFVVFDDSKRFATYRSQDGSLLGTCRTPGDAETSFSAVELLSNCSDILVRGDRATLLDLRTGQPRLSIGRVANVSVSVSTTSGQIALHGWGVEPRRNRVFFVRSEGVGPVRVVDVCGGISGDPLGVRQLSATARLTSYDHLVAECADGIETWDGSTGRLLFSTRGRSSEWFGPVTAAEITEDGSFVVRGYSNGEVRIISTAMDSVVETLSRSTGEIERIALAAAPSDGVVTYSRHGTLRVWREPPSRLRLRVPVQERDLIRATDGAVSLPAARPDPYRRLGFAPAAVTSLARTSDPDQLVVGRAGGIIEIRNVSSGELVRSKRGPVGQVRSAIPSSTGASISAEVEGRGAWVWDLASDLARAFPDDSRLASDMAVLEVRAGGLSATGIRAAFGGWSVWDAAHGSFLYLLGSPLTGPRHLEREFGNPIEGGTPPPLDLGMAPGGRYMFGYVNSGFDCRIFVWDNGAYIRTLVGPGAGILGAAISRDGARVAAATNSSIYVWASSTGERLLTLSHSAARYSALTFSPDGEFLAAAAPGGTLRVWSTSSGRLLHEFAACGGGIGPALSYLTDRDELAVGCNDGSLEFWRVADMTPQAATRWVLHRTNLRVCRDSFHVIPVDITPTTADVVWAPEADCRAAAEAPSPPPTRPPHANVR